MELLTTTGSNHRQVESVIRSQPLLRKPSHVPPQRRRSRSPLRRCFAGGIANDRATLKQLPRYSLEQMPVPILPPPPARQPQAHIWPQPPERLQNGRDNRSGRSHGSRQTVEPLVVPVVPLSSSKSLPQLGAMAPSHPQPAPEQQRRSPTHRSARDMRCSQERPRRKAAQPISAFRPAASS